MSIAILPQVGARGRCLEDTRSSGCSLTLACELPRLRPCLALGDRPAPAFPHVEEVGWSQLLVGEARKGANEQDHLQERKGSEAHCEEDHGQENRFEQGDG